MTSVVFLANTSWYLFNFRLRLAEYLHDQGAEVILAAPPDRFSARIEKAGFAFHPWALARGRANPIAEIRAVADCLRLYRARRPDLVHHFTVQSVLYGSLAARLAAVPAIVNSFTGLGYLFMRSGPVGEANRLVLRWLYRWTMSGPRPRAVFQNQDDLHAMIEMGVISHEKSVLIRGSGVDPDRFRPEPEPPGRPVILMASRMLRDKGVVELVQAARILTERGHSFCLRLAGDVDPGNPTSLEESDLRRLAEADYIEWLGYREDIAELYGRSHVVALPSYREGLPKSLIEAAASGRPLVASDVPGCREVVHDGVNGFLVPVKQAEPLADALERLLERPDLRAEMGLQARKMAVEKFSDEIVNKETWHLYQDLLVSSRRSGQGGTEHR